MRLHLSVWLVVAGCAPQPLQTETVLVSGLDSPASLVSNGHDLVWVNERTGDLMRVSTAGGVPEVLAPAQVHPHSLVLTGSVLTYATGAQRVEPHAVMQVSLDGGPPTTLVTLTTSADDFVEHLTVRNGEVFWVMSTRIARLAKPGGPVQTILESDGSVFAIAVNDADVYWLSFGYLERVSKTGSDASRVGPESYLLTSFVLSDSYVYVSTYYGEIARTPLAGGPRELLSPESFPRSMVLDGSTLYWAAGGDPDSVDHRFGTIRRMRAGQSPETLIAGDADPQSLVLAGDELFWLDARAGTLLHTPANATP